MPLVGGDGAGAGPFADGDDVFTAGDAEGLRGGKFAEKNLGGELLSDGEGRVEAGDDGLFDFGAGEAVAGIRKRGKIERCGIAAAFFQVQGEKGLADGDAWKIQEENFFEAAFVMNFGRKSGTIVGLVGMR